MHVEYVYNTPWKFLFGADVKNKEITNYGKACCFMIFFTAYFSFIIPLKKEVKELGRKYG